MTNTLDRRFFEDLERWNQAVCEAMARRDMSSLGWLCPAPMWQRVSLKTDAPADLCEALRSWGLECRRSKQGALVCVPPDEVLLQTILGELELEVEIVGRAGGALKSAAPAAFCLPVKLQPHEIAAGSATPELRWLPMRVFGAVCQSGRLIPRARRCLILWNTPWGIWTASDMLKPSLQPLAGGRKAPMWSPGLWRRWRGVSVEPLPTDAAPTPAVWPPVERRLARSPKLLAHQASLVAPVYLLGDRTLLYAAGTGRQLHRLGGVDKAGGRR